MTRPATASAVTFIPTPPSSGEGRCRDEGEAELGDRATEVESTMVDERDAATGDRVSEMRGGGGTR